MEPNKPSASASAAGETATVFLTQAWTALSAIATQSLLAWLLGPADRGAYAVCILFASVLGVVFTIGADRGAQYFVMSKNLRESDAIRSMNWIIVVGSGVAVVVGRLLIDLPLEFFAKADHESLLFALLLIPAFNLWTALRLQSAGLRQFRFLAVVDVARTVTNIGLLIALVFGAGMAVRGALSAQLICLIVVSTMIWVSLVRNGYLSGLLPSLGAVKAVSSYGLKYYVARLGHVIDMSMGTFLLAFLATREEIGIFAAASAMTLSLLMVPQSIEVILLPRVAADPSGRPDLVARVTRVSVLITLLMAILLAVLATPLVWALLSAKFLDAVPVIRILAIGVVIQSAGVILMSFFRGNNRPQLCSLAVWLGLVVNGAGILILYPVMGIAGAATAMALGFLARVITLMVAFVRLNGVGLGTLLKPNSHDIRLARDYVALLLSKFSRRTEADTR